MYACLGHVSFEDTENNSRVEIIKIKMAALVIKKYIFRFKCVENIFENKLFPDH